MTTHGPRFIAGGLAIAWLLAGCGHSEPFVVSAPETHGPAAAGNDTRLTFSAVMDYGQSWSEDGTSLLYRYAQAGRPDDDRCMGLLPAAGGTQLWSYCDTSAGDADTSSSILGAALGTDGRLLYEELTAKKNKPVPDHYNLWLADTASPFFHRRLLLALPVTISGAFINALSEIQWTASDQFVALASELQFPQSSLCIKPCFLVDTVPASKFLMRGTVTSTGATLTPIDGTALARQYSFAANGAAVVFVRSTLNVEQVPATGGTPTIVTTFTPTNNRSILDLTCKGGGCIVLTMEVRPPVPPATVSDSFYSLWKVALADGTQVLVRSGMTVLSTPRVAPTSFDIAIQSGLRSASDLYLFKGLLP